MMVLMEVYFLYNFSIQSMVYRLIHGCCMVLCGSNSSRASSYRHFMMNTPCEKPDLLQPRILFVIP